MTLEALLPLTPRLIGAPDSMVTIPDSDHPPTVDLQKAVVAVLQKRNLVDEVDECDVRAVEQRRADSYRHPA